MLAEESARLSRSIAYGICAVLVLSNVTVSAVKADVIWSGDFETANFMQYHRASDPNSVSFWFVPEYGAPAPENLDTGESYYPSGDGSLLSLVQSPTRQGAYAARFMVKNSANGSEPDDCDPAGDVCKRRRTQLTSRVTMSDYYDALPYMSSRWISISAYLPSDFETGSGWGPLIFGHKPRNESGLSGLFNIEVSTARGWKINHRWSPVENPSMSDIPWQQQMFYQGYIGDDRKPYPRESSWSDGLLDYPDIEASQGALQSVNVGGWTDWIAHIRYDARGSEDGGTGFLRVWKREDSGDWVQVLDIMPKRITRGGMSFDHGIGYNSPACCGNNGGFGINPGLYMQKEAAWDAPGNIVVYLDNIKIGDESATFSDMAPDASAPSTQSDSTDGPVPSAPELSAAE